MTVYSVDAGNGDAPSYFATKREAMTFARKCTPEDGYPVVVECLTLIPINKAAIVQLLNASGGYVDAARVIAQFPTTNKVTQ